MRISEAYPSKYFKAADLGGKERTVKISGCFNEELGQGSDKKTRPVLYFEGHKKGLVINKTNSIAISEIYGDETEAWVGKMLSRRTMFTHVLYACLTKNCRHKATA